MGCGLLRRDRVAQWQNFGHDCSRVDQVRDLGEVFGIRMNGDGRVIFTKHLRNRQ
jgi:hypothetical protein